MIGPPSNLLVDPEFMKSIHDTRRDNLRRLIDGRFGGSQTELAKAVGLGQPSFVSRLLTDREGTRKNIGNRLARRVESSLGLSPNWLDAADPDSRGEPGRNLDFDLGFDLVPSQPRQPAHRLPAGVERRSGQALLLTASELGQFPSIAAVHAAGPRRASVAAQSRLANEHLVGLRLPDDSMGERFPAGSIAVITDDQVPHGGNFVVGVLPGAPAASMRQWVEAAERRFLLPLNRAYSAAEVSADFRLLGVVVEAIQLLR